MHVIDLIFQSWVIECFQKATTESIHAHLIDWDPQIIFICNCIKWSAREFATVWVEERVGTVKQPKGFYFCQFVKNFHS